MVDCSCENLSALVCGKFITDLKHMFDTHKSWVTNRFITNHYVNPYSIWSHSEPTNYLLFNMSWMAMCSKTGGHVEIMGCGVLHLKRRWWQVRRVASCSKMWGMDVCAHVAKIMEVGW